MKNLFLCIAVCLLAPALLRAQAAKKPAPAGSNQSATFAASLPVGVFQRSHFAGAGLDYSWSHHRFGSRTNATRWIGFTFNAGGDYYFGKKVNTAGYPFRYDGYIYLHALAGAVCNPWSNTSVTLTAGPVFGLYSGNTDTGLGVDLSGSYYLKKNIGIGPSLQYRKQATNTDALWALAIRASYIF